jgi:hypothetical protein
MGATVHPACTNQNTPRVKWVPAKCTTTQWNWIYKGIEFCFVQSTHRLHTNLSLSLSLSSYILSLEPFVKGKLTSSSFQICSFSSFFLRFCWFIHVSCYRFDSFLIYFFVQLGFYILVDYLCFFVKVLVVLILCVRVTLLLHC